MSSSRATTDRSVAAHWGTELNIHDSFPLPPLPSYALSAWAYARALAGVAEDDVCPAGASWTIGSDCRPEYRPYRVIADYEAIDVRAFYATLRHRLKPLFYLSDCPYLIVDIEDVAAETCTSCVVTSGVDWGLYFSGAILRTAQDDEPDIKALDVQLDLWAYAILESGTADATIERLVALATDPALDEFNRERATVVLALLGSIDPERSVTGVDDPIVARLWAR